MADGFDKLLNVVQGRVSAIHARAIVDRAMDTCRGVDGRVTTADMPRVVARVERSLRLFMDPAEFEKIRAELVDLLPSELNDGRTLVVDVTVEGDIVVARSRARELCRGVGADKVPMQKAITIVSELARNIVSYTPGGHLELTPARSPRVLRIRAIDRGQGISDVDYVLSGRYKSRTGLGMGLLGTKRLATRFSINSGPQGTVVEAEVAL